MKPGHADRSTPRFPRLSVPRRYPQKVHLRSCERSALHCLQKRLEADLPVEHVGVNDHQLVCPNRIQLVLDAELTIAAHHVKPFCIAVGVRCSFSGNAIFRRLVPFLLSFYTIPPIFICRIAEIVKDSKKHKFYRRNLIAELQIFCILRIIKGYVPKFLGGTTNEEDFYIASCCYDGLQPVRLLPQGGR